MNKENARVLSMIMSNNEDDLPPSKPSKIPQIAGGNINIKILYNKWLIVCFFFNFSENSKLSLPGEKTALSPQTYIIAQNPEILARLMKENENRIINPAAYTTPASVFNTLAVEVDTSKTINNDLALKTTKLPVSEFLKLDNTITRDEKATVLQRLQQDKIIGVNLNESMQTQVQAQQQQQQQQPQMVAVAGNQINTTTMNQTFITNMCPSTQYVRQNETQIGFIDPRFTTHQFSYNDSSDFENSLQSLPVGHSTFLGQEDRTQQVIYDFGRNVPINRQMSAVCGSLERNVVQPHFHKTSCNRSIGGSLERNKSLINPINAPRKCVPRSASLERSVHNRDFSKSYSRSGSLEAYSSFLAYKNHMKNSPEYKAFEEEIYDVCPANIKNYTNAPHGAITFSGQTYMPMTPGNGFGYPNPEQIIMVQSMNATVPIGQPLNESDTTGLASGADGNNSKSIMHMLAEV